MPAPHPRMHGLTHVKGGADPVPCCVTTGTPGYPDTVLAHPCLAHYWPCDEPSGSLTDRKGTWNCAPTTDSTVFGSYPQYAAAGPFTELPAQTAIVNAGEFGTVPHDTNGFTGTIGTGNPIGGTSPFTLEAWVYLTSATFQSVIVYLGSSVRFQLFTPSWTLHFQCGAADVADSATAVTGAWVYLVGSYDGATARLYRNGTLVGSAACSGVTLSDSSVGLANIPATGASWAPLNGRLCQVAVYNCVLTAGEISSRYALKDSGGEAAAGDVLTADGSGGFSFEPPAGGGASAAADVTVADAGGYYTSANVEGALQELGAEVAGLVEWEDTGGPGTGAAAWMPLTTVLAGVPDLVWDANDSLIPTYTPL